MEAFIVVHDATGNEHTLSCRAIKSIRTVYRAVTLITLHDGDAFAVLETQNEVNEALKRAAVVVAAGGSHGTHRNDGGGAPDRRVGDGVPGGDAFRWPRKKYRAPSGADGGAQGAVTTAYVPGGKVGPGPDPDLQRTLIKGGVPDGAGGSGG